MWYFYITGIIGIVGIAFKEWAISFCRKKMKWQEKKYTKCQCLDFVEAAHRKQVYPLMYCHMNIVGELDVDQLKKAVQMSSNYIPEILYSYDFRHNRFVDYGFTFEHVIQMDDSNFDDNPVLDLGTQPQLKIIIRRKGKERTIIFCMSHILSDGAGFLQYLYLLASLYNGDCPREDLKNKRNIEQFLTGIYVQPQTEQTKYGKKESVQPLRPYSPGIQCYLIKRIISQKEFMKLHSKAKRCHVTLNDVFMTAYARVIAAIQNTSKVIIPCPADLRRFYEQEKECLTIANMTGVYRNIVIECESQYDFSTVLSQVSIETKLQKSRYRCFKGIRILAGIYRIIPHPLLEIIIRKTYQLLPVSYTNIGIIDHEKLFFRNCEIRDCIITGTYRKPPDFQLTVSSFQDVCTLNCTFVGDAETKVIAEDILERVAKELLEWADDNERESDIGKNISNELV